MKQTKSRHLHWFKHDLRLHDNPALIDAAGAGQLLCVYVVDPRWFRPSHYQSSHMGKHRWRFLTESLACLDNQLNKLGQKLWIVYGDPIEQLSQLVDGYHVDKVTTNRHCGVYERQQWQRLKNRFGQVNFHETQSHTLFEPSQLPFELQDLPKQFTPFRKLVEKINIDRPIQGPSALPPCLESGETLLYGCTQSAFNQPQEVASFYQKLSGGETSALNQLNYYLFESQKILEYKQTRNDLEGWDFSSKISAWLANGCLSTRQIYAAIKEFEQRVEANESTYWLYFELLWREYFYWYAIKHQSRLFQLGGIQNKRPLTSFWPQRFARWCVGNTPYPIVNACMKQLNTTGFMSNRGRQLVASCLVHELNLDWRYGAAYFEQQLIDFDVASNYGNWQYLAGVGADPRGHRQFDLAKQTKIYDPNDEFIQRWNGEASHLPLDDVDHSDWPISWN